jgi:hypothetical protein
LTKLYPANFDCILYWRSPIGIGFGREFVVHSCGQEENDITLSNSTFKQIDGVVALEPDEEIRVDDMTLDRRKELR